MHQPLKIPQPLLVNEKYSPNTHSAQTTNSNKNTHSTQTTNSAQNTHLHISSKLLILIKLLTQST